MQINSWRGMVAMVLIFISGGGALALAERLNGGTPIVHAAKSAPINFNLADGTTWMSIAHDGFYVRGVKVEQGPGEAQAVYEAWKLFMIGGLPDAGKR